MFTSRISRTKQAIKASALTGLFGVCVASGFACQQPTVSDSPAERSLARDQTPDKLWDDAVATLSEYGFRVRVQDRVNGQIITDPETSAQFYEVWRDDVGTNRGLMESSLHTTQRQVTVQFTNTKTEGWKVAVRVDVYRLSQPETQITTASGVLHGFSGYLPDDQGGSLRSTGTRKQWVPIGQDSVLEQELLRQILI